MNIYILIILCFYTLGRLVTIAKGINEEEEVKVVAGLIKLILGILAIVFHSHLNI